MSELGDQIEGLSDTQAVQAAGFVAECLRQQVEKKLKTTVSLDDNTAVEKLSETFPEASNDLAKLQVGSDAEFRAATARQFLAYCEQDPEYAGFVQDAMDQLAFKFEPFTIMAVTAGIVFLMQLKFKGTVQVDKPGLKGGFEIGKDSTSDGILTKILDVFKPGGSQK